jgi:hypothetical protein
VIDSVTAPEPFIPATLASSGAELWGPIYPQSAGVMEMWRQQMQLMESFHKDMILMVQMFMAMHRDHLASVRGELDMVQQLTGELSRLQAKLLEQPGTTKTGRDAGKTAPEKSGATAAPDRKHQAKKVVAHDPKDAGNAAEHKSAATEGRVERKSAKPGSSNGSTAHTSGAAAAGGQSDFHMHLTARIAELQRERQGYWKRILDVLNR